MVAVCAGKNKQALERRRTLKDSRIRGVKVFHLFCRCLIEVMSHFAGLGVNSEREHLELQYKPALPLTSK